MYGREYARSDGAAVDLSFSQILEARSSHQQQRRWRQQQPLSSNGRLTRQQLPPSSGARASPFLNGAGGMLDSVYESEEMMEESGSSSLDESQRYLTRQRRAGTGSSSMDDEDEEWATGDDGQLGQDVYRFVQPRRLSSWVQDDAVFACFKCHAVFSLLVRKHHCRYEAPLYSSARICFLTTWWRVLIGRAGAFSARRVRASVS